MRFLPFLCWLLIAVVPMPLLSAPLPQRKHAKPAVIDAGTEKNIAGVEWNIVMHARIGIRENKKVVEMALIRKQKDWQAWLKKNLHVERGKGKNLVRISFQDGNAEEQATIINVVVDYYLKNIVEDRRESLTKNLKTIKNGLENARRNLTITEKRLAKADKDIKDHEEYIRNLPKLV